MARNSFPEPQHKNPLSRKALVKSKHLQATTGSPVERGRTKNFLHDPQLAQRFPGIDFGACSRPQGKWVLNHGNRGDNCAWKSRCRSESRGRIPLLKALDLLAPNRNFRSQDSERAVTVAMQSLSELSEKLISLGVNPPILVFQQRE